MTATIKKFYAGLQTLIDGARGAHVDVGVFNAGALFESAARTTARATAPPTGPTADAGTTRL